VGIPAAIARGVGTAINLQQSEADGESAAKIGELLHRITDDRKTIASNEVELARIELERTAKRVVADAAVVVFGGIIALIGLGLLAVVAVVALAPVIPALWLRLLMMAIVYLIVGGAVAVAFGKKLTADAKPNLERPAREAQETVDAIKEGLRD
jgi:uncharacterized membrane protein YqjE